MRLRHVWSVLGIALTAVVSAPSKGCAQVEVGRAVVIGHVRSKADTSSIARAEVIIVGSRERQVSDSTGRFQFTGLYPGRYELHVRRLGFQEITKFVTVGSDERANVTIDLDVVAQQLREVRVAGRMIQVPWRYEEAYRRMARGFGDNITKEEIQRRLPFDTKSLLWGIPGVQARDYDLKFSRCGTDGTDQRFISVWVDGVKVTKSDYPPIWALRDIPPYQIELMEVYRGISRIPAEFLDGACAVIVIWTKSY